MSCQSVLGLLGVLALVPVLSQRQFTSQARTVTLAEQVQPAKAQRENAQPVFRGGIDLFTVDAVVTDRDRRPVTDLSADDFEIAVDGRRQMVRHVVYIPVSSTTGDRHADARPRDLGGLLRDTSAPATAAEVARTIAIVVDDIGLSFESVVTVRRALERFLDEQMTPGDLVAILRTSAGVGSLQQFTTDRRLLHAAAEHVRWTGLRHRPAGTFDGVAVDLQVPAVGPPGMPSGSADKRERAPEDTVEGLRDSMFTVGTFGALEFAIRGVAALPGRKSVVLMSDGFDLDRRQTRVWEAARRLIDAANRAGVVLYTIDARGLQTLGATAEMGSAGAIGMSRLMHSQEGLLWLAEQTGGVAVVNNNDLNVGFSRVLADQAGYYLVGYEGREPGRQGLWEPGRVRVRVHRDGLRVRWRQGLFGPADARRVPQLDRDPLVAAALSPFVASDVIVRLTALFGHDTRSGPYLNLLYLIDPARLTLTRTPSGVFEGEVEVLTIAVDDNGQLAARLQRRLRMRLGEAEYRHARTHGLLYSTTLRIARTGGVQVRAVLRDTASGRVGSGSQFVELPAVGRGKLAVSGVVMNPRAAGPGPAVLRGVGDTNEQGTATLMLDAAAETGDSSATVDDAASESLLGHPALRVFSAGSAAVYAYEIYSGLRSRDRLTTSVRLLRNGRPVYETPPSPVGDSTAGKPVAAVPIAGSLTLGHDMPEGTYTLQVTVVADRPGRRDLTASRWVDFEVVRMRPARPEAGRPQCSSRAVRIRTLPTTQRLGRLRTSAATSSSSARSPASRSRPRSGLFGDRPIHRL